MYVAIVALPGRGVAAYGTPTAPNPLILPPGAGPARTAPLCPPDQIDRATGAVTVVRHIITVPRTFAITIAATPPASNLHGPLIGLLVQPRSGRLIAIGPFNQPTDLDRWWRWRDNRQRQAHIVHLPITLHTQPTGDPR